MPTEAYALCTSEHVTEKGYNTVYCPQIPSQGTGENTLVLSFFRRVRADMNRIEL